MTLTFKYSEQAKVDWTGGNNKKGERLTKRLDALRVEGTMRRGRPRLRWEDSAKRGLAGVGGEWRSRATERGVWTVAYLGGRSLGHDATLT